MPLPKPTQTGSKHFSMDITERGTVRLYWDGLIWEGPQSALQELERMIGCFSFHREYNPSLKLRLTVEEPRHE